MAVVSRTVRSICFDSFGLKAALVRQPSITGRLHHHQEVELNYLFSGGITYLHYWQRRRLPLRRLVAFWGAAPHALVEAEPGSELAWVTVPLPWLLQWNLPAPFLRRLLGGEWCEETRAGSSAERYPVRAWVDEINQARVATTDAIGLELQAALLRLAPPGRPGERVRRSVSTGSWRGVESMARFMAEHFAEDIDLSAIAASAKLHPKYAMTLFKRWCGLTVHDYLQQHRIAHAQRLLLTTDTKVIDVALASGFGSLSAFYDAFQRSTQSTPTQFRRRDFAPDAGA